MRFFFGNQYSLFEVIFISLASHVYAGFGLVSGTVFLVVMTVISAVIKGRFK